MGPRLIILGHGAERTGPPVFLLRLLGWIRANTDVDVTVVLAESGPLLPHLRSLAQTLIAGVDPLDDLPPMDAAYVNTASSIRLLDLLPHSPTRVVTHVHELSTGLEAHLTAAELGAVVERSDQILVVSEAVAADLAARVGVARQHLMVVRGFVSPELVAGAVLPAPQVGPGPLVVAAGTLDWRKGIDLFVEVCALVAARSADVRFCWVGGDRDAPAARDALVRLADGGLADRVTLVGEQPDPHRWFRAASVFLLPSREDAFPLVCLEAAALAVPTVCFASGGITEFVRDDAGIVVPFPDRQAMADAVTGLLADDERRTTLGAAARRRVLDAHTPDVVCPTLLQAILGPARTAAAR